jgi:pullulanase/glycogen debranching enzyme
MQNMGLSIVSLSQGVPFFHAGSDLLRSKSMDRNSYNSGDWFNAIDWDPETNNWGIGLPPAGDNQDMWPVIGELLANPDLAPTAEDVAFTAAHAQEMWQIRRSSPLFRLQTAQAIRERVAFHNTGPEQLPGLIVMSLSDMAGEDLDPDHDLIVVLFNANDEELSFSEEALAGLPLTLHPIQADSVDPVVGEAAFDAETGTFTAPGRTTAVFILGQGESAAATEDEATETAEEEPAAEAEEEEAAPAGSASQALAIFAAALAGGALIGLLAVWGAWRGRKRQAEEGHGH